LCPNAELPKDMKTGAVWFCSFGITIVLTEENHKCPFKEETKMQKTGFIFSLKIKATFI